MKTLKLALILSAIVFSSCSQRQSLETADTMDAESSASPVANPVPSAEKALSQMPVQDIYSDGATKLIKKADYRFEVTDMKKSTAAVEAAIKSFPAYISASNLQLESSFMENKITIRVQNEYFQSLLNEIDKQATHVDRRHVTTEDVSKEFVDLESRIKTKREVEARYMEILRKKAGTIEELLNAEQQIGALHEDIEATISRVNFLKDQVRYSAINLEFYQIIVPQNNTPEITLAGKLLEGLSSGWNGVMNVVIGLSYVWPILFGVGVALIIVYFLKRRKHIASSLPGKS